jgi:hypothetical protein
MVIAGYVPRMTDKTLGQASFANSDPQLNVGRLGGGTAGWDRPGHDGVVGEHDTDPDRRDLRAEIGKYVSLATFPATVQELVAAVAANGAPDEVTSALGGLEPQARFESTRDLWLALGLEAQERF